MRDESDPIIKQHMLGYLIVLMDDANDFSRTSAKASHAVLLCRMEQGEVKDFSDTAFIDRIRRTNAQKHVPNTTSSPSTHIGMHKKHALVTKSMPCTYFNQGSCLQQKSHETRGVLYKHICAACFANMQKWIVKTKPNTGQKTSRYGPIYRSRQFYNSNLEESKLVPEIQDHYKDWSAWLARTNSFKKVGSFS